MRLFRKTGTGPSGLVPVLCLLAVAFVLAGPAPGITPARGAERPQTILLITVDGARADLPLRSHDAPELAALGREGVVFGNATTPTALTFPATVSLLTGLYPHHHDVRDELRAPLGPGAETLAKRLSASGWLTAGYPDDYLCHARSGIATGFGAFDLDSAELSDSARVDSALAFLRGHPRDRCFVWAGFTFSAEHPVWERYLGSEAADSSEYLARARAIDIQVGRLHAGLQQLGLLPQTVFMVIGTHGESVPGWQLPQPLAGETSLPGHGLDLSDETMRVPWVIRLPDGSGEVRGERTIATGWTSTIDLFPTVLELAGVAAAPDVDGISLVPYLRGEALPSRLLFHEADLQRAFGWGSRVAVRGRNAKLLCYGGKTALIPLGGADAAAASREAVDLAPALAREFRMEPPALPTPAAPDSAFGRDDEGIRLLLQVRPTARRRNSAPPGTLAQLAARYPRNSAILAELALSLIYSRHEKQAADLLDGLLDARPELVELEALYVEHLLFFTRFDVAISRLENRTGFPMFEADRIWRLGAAHVASGQSLEAERTYALAAKVGAPPARRWRRFQEQAGYLQSLRLEIQDNPADTDAYLKLGVALWNLGLYQSGYIQIQQGRARASTMAEPEYILGHYLALEGRAKNAAGAFERALQKDPKHLPARVELAYAQIELGDLDAARQNLEQAAASGEADARVHYNLACLLVRRGDKESALRELETAVRKGYTNRAGIENDPDLAPLRADPRFRALLSGTR